MKTNILTLVITLTVGIILAGALLMPVISDATTTERTFTNDGYQRYASIESSATDGIEIVWDHTAPRYFTVNDEEVDMITAEKVGIAAIFGNSWMIKYYLNGSVASLTYSGATASDYLYVDTSGTKDMTITLSEGTATITDGTTTKTATYTSAYYVDAAGPMVMKKSADSAYVLSNSSVIVQTDNQNVTGGQVGVFFSGTVDDGYTFNIYRNTLDVTESNVESATASVSGYKNLVTISTISFDLTPSESSSTSVTKSMFLVPYEVTAELSNHLNDAEIAIMMALPILVIVSLVVAAVSVIGRNND